MRIGGWTAALILGGSALVATAPASAADGGAGGFDRAQMEELLLRGEVGTLRPLSTGVTGSSRATVTWQGRAHDAHVQTVDAYIGRPGVRLRDLSDHYAYNVAAYRVDRLLGLDLVPVSVERSVHGEPAAVTWWVDDVEMMERERQQLGRLPTDVRAWNRQIHRARVFQELISNSDFNQTNVLITTTWRVWLVDFTRAFRGRRRLGDPSYATKIDAELLAALGRLDQASLRAETKGLLAPSQVRAILARRDLLVAGALLAAPPSDDQPKIASGG
jgi:hypothetical protein